MAVIHFFACDPNIQVWFRWEVLWSFHLSGFSLTKWQAQQELWRWQIEEPKVIFSNYCRTLTRYTLNFRLYLAVCSNLSLTPPLLCTNHIRLGKKILGDFWASVCSTDRFLARSQMNAAQSKFSFLIKTKAQAQIPFGPFTARLVQSWMASYFSYITAWSSGCFSLRPNYIYYVWIGSLFFGISWLNG